MDLGPVRLDAESSWWRVDRDKSSRHPPSGSAREELSDSEMKLLELLAGGRMDRPQSEYIYVVLHLRALLDSYGSQNWAEHLSPPFCQGQAPRQRLWWLCCEVVEVFRHQHNISIARLLQKLQQTDVVRPLLDEADSQRTKDLLFSVVGWLSHLYIPILGSKSSRQDCFRIDSQGAKYPARTAVGVEKSQRPMDELLRALGETIPQHIAMSPDHGRNEDEQPNLKFQVSCLNAATLTSIAGIQLIWVDTISAHLDFDASVPALYLFRLPSFCRLQSGDDSFLSILTEDLYTENSKSTDDFSVSRLMKEISLSYRMLFRDDRSARELYRRSQRAKASIITATGGRSTDPHLDMLAGLDLPTSFFSPRQHVRETYHADSDFPILRKRLNRIQLYVDGIQPGRLTSLWRDRRDLRLWYTIWAVLIIGGIGVIQAFFAISLAAAQVGIARQSLKLQLQQLPR